jgi:hypothetical protein
MAWLEAITHSAFSITSLGMFSGTMVCRTGQGFKGWCGKGAA